MSTVAEARGEHRPSRRLRGPLDKNTPPSKPGLSKRAVWVSGTHLAQMTFLRDPLTPPRELAVLRAVFELGCSQRTPSPS